MSEIKGYPLGVCQKHRKPKISIDGTPVCLSCHSEAERAKAVPAGVVRCADPGDAGMKNIKPGPVSIPPQIVQPPAPVVGGNRDFDTIIESAISLLSTAPMPKNLKHYKAVQRAIKALESTIQAPEA